MDKTIIPGKEGRRVCLINDSFPPIIDGVSNVVLNYARIIEQKHGHSLVVTPEVPGADDSGYTFPVVRYPSIDTRKLVGYVAGYPFSPEAAYRIKEEQSEVLHVHCPMTAAILARQIQEAMDLPLIMTWHTKYDIDIANAIRSKLLQESALHALLNNVNACNEIWTVSKGAGENLKSLGYEGDYIVMPNGVDLPRETVSEDKVNAVSAGYDLPHNVPCFLFIGRLMWYKGLRIILDALAQLHREGADFRMVFVGGGGDEKEVREYTQELGLSQKVFFTGVISRRELLRAWYARADLFLFPSTFDTNGLVVREAAASDTPAVIVSGSCAAEGVTDGQNGFLIEENAESLAAKLRELTAHPEIIKKAGKGAGNELYISWDDAVARACERYEVVIDRHRSGYYPKRLPYDYDFFRAHGELMEALGSVDAAGKHMLRDAAALYNELDMTIRSARNKTLTDMITAGYEAQQSIEEIKHDTIENLQAIHNGIKSQLTDTADDIFSQIQEAKDDFLNLLERYL